MRSAPGGLPPPEAAKRARSVRHRISVSYGTSVHVWARGARDRPKLRFAARAGEAAKAVLASRARSHPMVLAAVFCAVSSLFV